MDKIILRSLRTGETKTVDRDKYEKLKPEMKALFEIVAEPSAEQFTEAERLAGKGESTASTLVEAAKRTLTFGAAGEPPTSLAGAGAEAVGAGLRDAVLSLGAGRLLGPRAAAAVPTVTGALEGAVAAPGQRAAGAVIGGLTANIPMPKIVERAVGKVGGALGEAAAAAKKRIADKRATAAAAALEEAQSKVPAGITAETIGRLQQPSQTAVGRTQGMIDAEPGGLSGPAARQVDDVVDAEQEAMQEIMPKLADVDVASAAAELADDALAVAKTEAAKLPKAGTIAAQTGMQGGMADLVRQAPEQAVAAILADPRLEGRDLSTISPREMLAALKRAVQLIGDEDARVRELAIREANK
jgi:hypothetical protein